MECVRLRIKDVDFQRKQLLVRNGKGNKAVIQSEMKNTATPLMKSRKSIK